MQAILRFCLVAIAALAFGAAHAAVAIPRASAVWAVTGPGIDRSGALPLFPGDKDGEFLIGTNVPGQSLVLGGRDDGWRVTVNGGRLDADPIITYNFGVTNFTPSPLTFAFEFSTPLSPTFSDPVEVGASIGQSFTWLGGTPYVFTPLAGSGKTAVATLNGGTVNMGVDVGNGFSNPAFSFGSSSNFDNVPLFVTSLGGGLYTDFKVRLEFSLSGGDSAVGFNGQAIINPVPVPAALPLVLAGLGLLGFVGIRRR